ncbi:MAG: glycosyltransferase family 4 protein [Acidimicrobiia bacterium]|nr:glycosyltransferase family 4 protein [Acidimicrobiia bacterium]
MQVAIDATPLLQPLTGIGVFTAAIARELTARDDVDLTAFTVTWRGRHRLADGIDASIGRRGWPVPARATHWLWARAPFPPAELVAGRADLYHGTNYVVPPSARRAMVVSVHDLVSVHHPEWCTAPVRQFPVLIQKAIDRGAWVHADSEHMAAAIRDEFDVEPERVVSVPLGADAPAAIDHAPRGQTTAPYLLALGTIEPRKDHPTLVAAFDRLAGDHPELRLVVAGADGWGVGPFDRALADAVHSDRIERRGYVSDAERHALLTGADVLVYPSLDEGFGLPPLEAMQLGIPVVATAVGSIPEVVGDAAELAPPGDVDALAGAMSRALEPDRAATLASAGPQRARQFTWKRTAAGLCQLYEGAIDSV